MIPGDDEFKEIDPENLNDDSGVAGEETVASDDKFEEIEADVEASTEVDDNTVTVQPVQFASFEDLDQVAGPQNQNLKKDLKRIQ